MRELTIQEAEALAGCRLDRRRAYATTDDGEPCDVSGCRVFEVCSFTAVCSGCSTGGDYLDSAGMGCSECGYTGRRRQEHWVPSVRELAERTDKGEANV